MNKDILRAFDLNGGQDLTIEKFYYLLSKQGLSRYDPRLSGIDQKLTQSSKVSNSNSIVNLQGLNQLITEKRIVRKAIQNQNIVPDFNGFTKEIVSIYQQVKPIDSGEIASYIPQLARVDPSLFAVSVCTVDGQEFSIGDSEVKFSLQSSNKPINYAIALEELGEDLVHRHVGKEPSGVSFNALSLNEQGLPHNPLINAGAIMCASLIKSDLNLSDKFEYIIDIWHQLNGHEKPTFNNSVYLSERDTADRNFALAYFMRENKAFPDRINIREVLEFYFQCCSVESDSRMLARVAATFANSGINPFTSTKVFQPETVKNCLSMMYSCGMYDYSGEFAFSVGLPAKSGVSGVIWLVIPNVMGISIYSPRLDHHGNSVRAIEFAQQLVGRFNFHNYDSLNFESHNKKDPRRKKYETKTSKLMTLIFAAAAGDLDEIRRLHAMGTNLAEPDYDGRTALHLAASENQLDVVKYLLENGVPSHPKDRWGGTPLSDAKRAKHKAIVELFNAMTRKAA